MTKEELEKYEKMTVDDLKSLVLLHDELIPIYLKKLEESIKNTKYIILKGQVLVSNLKEERNKYKNKQRELYLVKK